MDYNYNYYNFADNRFLVESNHQKESIIRLSKEEYSELKEMGMYTKKEVITNLIGELHLEINIYFPDESDEDFIMENDKYIVPLDSIGAIIICSPEDEDEEDE